MLWFYRFDGYKGWDEDTADSDDEAYFKAQVNEDDNAELALYTAIGKHPEKAHTSLAMLLGLDYNAISAFMQRAEVMTSRRIILTGRGMGVMAIL